ncbi:MAG: EamA family transporter [Paracoccaceae bacterium]
MSDTLPPRGPSVVNWIEIFALGVIWGGSFLSVRLALEGFTPFTVAAGRIVIATVALGLLCWLRGLRLPGKGQHKVWLHAMGMAFFTNALPFSLIAWAQQHVTSGFAGISMALVPLFTLVLAHYLLPNERLSVPRMIGFGFGLCGVVVLIGTDALHPHGGALEPVARVLCIAATCSYAIGSIITRRCPPVDPVVFSTTALIGASAMIVPVALLVDGIPAVPPSGAMLALLYLGLMPTAFATLLMVHVIRTAGPTFLTQTNYHVPVWSVILGTLVLSEPLPAQFVIALGLILTGLAISRRALRRA